jgi:hypothetical protein
VKWQGFAFLVGNSREINLENPRVSFYAHSPPIEFVQMMEFRKFGGLVNSLLDSELKYQPPDLWPGGWFFTEFPQIKGITLQRLRLRSHSQGLP